MKPILLLTFNRPDLTRKVFEILKVHKPTKLYVSSDGPRESNFNDKFLVQSTREIFNEIDWECDLKTKFQAKNLGCKNAVVEALDWFFMNEGDGIILEDDTVPGLGFFRYCAELLDQYKDHSEISMISGDNFSFGKLNIKESYYFSRYTHVWGWATWKSSWQRYKPDIKNDLHLFEKCKNSFENEEYQFWNHLFNQVADNQIDTWDLQWVFYNFLGGMFSIMPKFNLIRNIGFREDATHTKETTDYSNLIVNENIFPMVHPEKLIINEIADNYSRSTFLPKASNGILETIRRKFFVL